MVLSFQPAEAIRSVPSQQTLFRVLSTLAQCSNSTQRELSMASGCSLGAVNETLSYLRAKGCLESEPETRSRRERRDYKLSAHGHAELAQLKKDLRPSLLAKLELLLRNAEALKRELEGR